MHYIPDSAREFLSDSPVSRDGREPPSFHYQSAPIYLLTVIVGALLATDILVGLIDDPQWMPYRQLLGFRLALLAAVLGGARILYQTLEGLFAGKVGADLALTIACLAAILVREHETAALVVLIALIGESIEGFTVDRAQSAIRGIFQLCPPIAHVVRDGEEIDVPVDELVHGDSVAVRPGERVPADGVVLSGGGSVDQSALTGESVPADKVPGDRVFAGTLNQLGHLVLTVQRVGDETQLAEVTRLVAEAAERKAPLERSADRLARLFLPAVLLVAFLTLVGWWWRTGDWNAGVLPALSVLVVACPCPLILATPSAVMAAMAWLARRGVVVKGSLALERFASVDTIAFDKTGTLTSGDLSIVEVQAELDLPNDELIRVAAIADRNSEHVIARLIVREAELRQCVLPDVSDFTAHPGMGVTALVRRTVLGEWASSFGSDAEATVQVGNRRWFRNEGLTETGQAADDFVERMDATGATIVHVAVDGQLLGTIAVTDTIRHEADLVLRELRSDGIGTFHVLTGDREPAAKAIANRLGLAGSVSADCLPSDKAAWITEAERGGHRVAMVGDGVNDAPALATATVGIALGGVGSDIAGEAGDLVLMGDPLRPLPGLLRLSRQLVRTIRQSIYLFAFGLNGLGVVLAATGVLKPATAALFHEVGSLAVMLNALRLLWFERWEEAWPGRLVRSLGRPIDALSAWLSPSQIVFRVVDNLALVLRLAIAGLVAVWLASGITFVRSNERIIVTRFGQRAHEGSLGPGWYWRWPDPLEVVHRRDVDRLRTMPIGFRRAVDRAMSNLGSVEWGSDHRSTTYRSVPEESLAVTGDELLVELSAELQYRIADLDLYLFGQENPDEVLRALTESAIRHVVAMHSLDAILTRNRELVEARAMQRVRELAKLYALGVEVVELNVLELHPPTEVVPAYRDVANALEQQQRLLNHAGEYLATRLIAALGEEGVAMLRLLDRRQPGDVESLDFAAPDANETMAGEVARVLADASGAAAQRIGESQGNADRFGLMEAAHRDAPELVRHYLYWSRVVATLSGRSITVVDPRAARRKHVLILDSSWPVPSLMDAVNGPGFAPNEFDPAARTVPPSENDDDHGLKAPSDE